MSNKTLAEWLDFISSTHPSEIEMGLDRIKSVFAQLSAPAKSTKVVLVAGTNGKGSTIAMMEAGLLSLGYRVGAYTSPHILHYNERVRINASDVSDELLIQAFERVEQARKNTPLTYFEYGTLAAFEILFNAQLDVVLLEVGLGGRLDAVNIVDPDLSIITSIGIDHAEWLGDNIEKIGLEKAGILREKGLFVGGEDLPVSILNRANDLQCRTLLCRQNFNLKKTNDIKSILLCSRDKDVQLSGFPNLNLPENNILIALQSIFLIEEILDSHSEKFTQTYYDSLIHSFEQLVLPGRLENIKNINVKDIYIDVGHNPHAAVYLKSFLMKHASMNKQIQIVYSSLSDKDVLGVLSVLSPLIDRCVLIPLEVERAMPLDSLISLCNQADIKNVLSFASANEGIENAISFANASMNNQASVLTLIFGSFYMVEAAKRFFQTI